MAYPHLLYLGEIPPEPPFLTAALEDMRLSAALPALYADPSLGGLCTEEELAARQETFRLFTENAAKRAALSALYEKIDLICRCDAMLRKAKSKNESAFVLFAICEALADFVHTAAHAEIGGPLFGRFSEYFAQWRDAPRFAAMENDCRALLPRVKDALCFSVRYSTDARNQPEAVLTTAGGETYISRLAACAAALGCEYGTAETCIPPDRAFGDALGAFRPALTGEMLSFSEKHGNLYVDTILSYREQLAFYLELLALCDTVREAHIPLTFGRHSDGILELRQAYDISILLQGKKEIVPNGIRFFVAEPFFYVTGANGGGKTTYLRTVGISVLLYLLGAPSPCAEAHIPSLHGIRTHFPSDERFGAGDGRFADEERRMEQMLSQSAIPCLFLLNETFSTTTEEKATAKTDALAHRLLRSGHYALYVTHQHIQTDDLPVLCAEIDSADGNRRTFRITRSSGRSRSFAADILKKYGLTDHDLRLRFPQTADTGKERDG